MPSRIADRYEDLGPIARGGMGEVRRVRDTELQRTLAMKIVHAHLVDRPDALARFREEAQATAQLQHPNIVPVHDLGRLSDGRLWFTMLEVQGRTLSDVAAEVHDASGDEWRPGPSGWTFRRLITAFHAVCQAVAFAHERGVVHRDLKPNNAMVGTHGEVYVLDWGLAKLVGRPDPSTGAAADAVVSGRLDSGAHATRFGQVVGTPAYMPPEQARGEIERIDARSDVYALGAMLYHLLSGRAPYLGTPADIIGKVVHLAPTPIGQLHELDAETLELPDSDGLVAGAIHPTPALGRSGAGPAIPQDLIDACERAMQRDPADRHPTAATLADEIDAWLAGARRRAQALAVTERALALVGEAEGLHGQAERLIDESRALLEGVATWAPEAAKHPAWAKAKQAGEVRRAAELRQLEVDETLRAALQIDPQLPEAHAALALRYRDRHAKAEADRDADAVARAETLLSTHAAALPRDDRTRRDAARYLAGDGALTLVTDPPGAEVQLYRFVEENRRLVEVFERSLGTTPIHEVVLPMGSYVCVLSHPQCDEVRYPVQVTRLGHWHGVPPAATEPRPVWLPPRGFLGPDEVYVPAGWFRAGGDPVARTFDATPLWCDALVVDRHPVTNARYIEFLDDLVATGRTDEALRHAARQRPGNLGGLGPLIYGFDGERFFLQPDGEGDVWDVDFPVLNVDWFGARAFLAWRAERTGRAWRLAGELEWEKAARGVDGRFFPWGDHHDPAWACMRLSHEGRALPATIDRFPVDRSVYGARGMGGNTADFCLDLLQDPPASVERERVVAPDPADEASPHALRCVRGGVWFTSAQNSRCSNRARSLPTHRGPAIGFRGLYRPSVGGGAGR